MRRVAHRNDVMRSDKMITNDNDLKLTVLIVDNF